MSKLSRIAVINKDKCKPSKCNFECGLICPINKNKKECVSIVDIEDLGKQKKTRKIAQIVEEACIGCGFCAKPAENSGCPFGAVAIVNVPTQLNTEITHRYGKNGFRLYRMPILKQQKILGFIGQNGIGKSTVIKILSGKTKPNFELFQSELTYEEIIKKFNKNEMHKYMSRLYNNELTINIKPQHVESFIGYYKSLSQQSQQSQQNQTVIDYVRSKHNPNSEFTFDEVFTTLELDKIAHSPLLTLSGGELQRMLCATTLLSGADVYIFDEPTNYLDIQQRLNVGKLIKKLADFKGKDGSGVYTVVIEHDISILELVSDYICILYGEPGAYGVVSKPLNTSQGINIYFDGYIPSENMRFRKNEYSYKKELVSDEETADIDVDSNNNNNNNNNNKLSKISYESHGINYDKFQLSIESGSYYSSSAINVVMGKNGTGKTTFINHIAKEIGSSVSHKPQYLSMEQFVSADNTYPTVNEFLYNNIKQSYTEEMFKTDVVKPLNIESIKDRHLNELSGGEMQRFWIVYCLGRNAHIYLLDEPSACLDIEQRVIVTKVLKRFVLHNKKVMFVVEHDIMMAVSLGSELYAQAILALEDFSSNQIDSDDVRKSIIKTPVPFSNGINDFLKVLNITFRENQRINKLDSVKDREQKLSGQYYVQ